MHNNGISDIKSNRYRIGTSVAINKGLIKLHIKIMKRTSGKSMPTIRGIILPAEWDDKGNIKKILISTPNEEEYFVASNEKSKLLMDFLRQEVEVIGQVRENKFQKSITIQNFSVKHR